MTGYTRQSTGNMVTGNTMYASDFNNEFNQLQTAFDATMGHTHDGTMGNGPKVSLTGSVTGVLPVVNGGTGGTSPSTALANIVGYTPVNKAGDTMTGTLISPALSINNVSGQFKNLSWTTNNISRWVAFSTSTAESGGNVGSDFSLARFSDVGTYIDTPFAIIRSTGLTTISVLSLNTSLSVASGGTGASSASSARANLGAGKLTYNSGEIGSFAFLARTVTSGGQNPGDVVAGSYLQFSDNQGNVLAGSVSGTWVCMGYLSAQNLATLFHRIA